MPYGQKYVLNKSNRIVNKKLNKNVKVTKHFEPGIIYYNEKLQLHDFPEVNSDVDIIEGLCSIKRPNSKNQASKNSFYKGTAATKIHRSKQNKPKNVQQHSSSFQEHNLQSVSCFEEQISSYGKVNKIAESKSFVDVCHENTKISVFTSDNISNSDNVATLPNNQIKETALDRLKKEIVINRIEGFRTSSWERKEKMKKLRRDLGFLINPTNANNIKKGETKEKPQMLIYNVNGVRNCSLSTAIEKPRTFHNASQQPEKKESQMSAVSTLCHSSCCTTSDDVLIEKREVVTSLRNSLPSSKKVVQKTTVIEKSRKCENDSQQLEKQETKKSAGSTSHSTEEGIPKISTCSYCPTSGNSIRKKIQTANTLVDKVKTALQVFKKEKTNSIKSSESTDNEPESMPSESDDKIIEATAFMESENDPEVINCCDIKSPPALLAIKQILTDIERPKTRRPMSQDEEHIFEKYRTEPKKDLVMPDDIDYEILKTKLNAISESAESNDSKHSFPKEAEKAKKVSLVSVFTNTDPTLEDVKAIQVTPKMSITCTQTEFCRRNQSIQTEVPHTKESSTGHADRCQKRRVLEIQVLPQINIRSPFIVQKILNFSINHQGNTKILYKADQPNVKYVEVSFNQENGEATDIYHDTAEKDKTVEDILECVHYLQSSDNGSKISFNKRNGKPNDIGDDTAEKTSLKNEQEGVVHSSDNELKKLINEQPTDTAEKKSIVEDIQRIFKWFQSSDSGSKIPFYNENEESTDIHHHTAEKRTTVESIRSVESPQSSDNKSKISLNNGSWELIDIRYDAIEKKTTIENLQDRLRSANVETISNPIKNDSINPTERTSTNSSKAMMGNQINNSIDSKGKSANKTFISSTELRENAQPDSNNVKDTLQTKISEDSNPRIYNIGFYKTASTQCDSPAEISKSVISENYEEISFSITISTETSESEHVEVINSDVTDKPDGNPKDSTAS